MSYIFLLCEILVDGRIFLLTPFIRMKIQTKCNILREHFYEDNLVYALVLLGVCVCISRGRQEESKKKKRRKMAKKDVKGVILLYASLPFFYFFSLFMFVRSYDVLPFRYASVCV